jgi:hypothetical protein
MRRQILYKMYITYFIRERKYEKLHEKYWKTSKLLFCSFYVKTMISGKKAKIKRILMWLVRLQKNSNYR